MVKKVLDEGTKVSDIIVISTMMPSLGQMSSANFVLEKGTEYYNKDNNENQTKKNYCAALSFPS